MHTSNCQGHIALDQAVFPEDTPGFVLDAFARSFLWKVGLDYRHGIFLLPVVGCFSFTYNPNEFIDLLSICV